MNIFLRAPVIEDAQMLSDIAIKAFYETYAAFNTQENMESYVAENFTTTIIIDEIKSENAFCFFAFCEEELAGYILLKINSNKEIFFAKQIEVARIYVLKKYQQLKIGWQLINQAIEFSKENNFEVLWLGVWTENRKAINFYQRVGFKIFSEHIFMLGNDAQKDFLMKLNL